MCLPLIPAALAAVGGAVTAGAATGATATAIGAATTIGVAGAGISAYGQYQSGLAQSKMYQYQQQQQTLQANYDVSIGNAQSQAIEETGNLQNKQLVQNQAQLEGSQKAAEGAQGTAGSVTAENIASSTFTKEQLDQQMLRYNTDIKAQSAQEQAAGEAWGATTTAGQDNLAATNAKVGGEYNAAGTLLGAAGSVASTAVRIM